MVAIVCPKCGKKWFVSKKYRNFAKANFNDVCGQCRGCVDVKEDKYAGWEDTMYTDNPFKHTGRGVQRHTDKIAASGHSPDTYLPDGTLIEDTGTHEAMGKLLDALDSGRYSK